LRRTQKIDQESCFSNRALSAGISSTGTWVGASQAVREMVRSTAAGMGELKKKLKKLFETKL
jgi:hypothetical protein